MEASQILCGLLENSGGQLSLARLGDVFFARLHLVDLFVSFSSFRRSTFQKTLKLLRDPRPGCLDQRQNIARARRAARTPSNGLETTNQNEMSQLESVFTLDFQAFEDRY